MLRFFFFAFVFLISATADAAPKKLPRPTVPTAEQIEKKQRESDFQKAEKQLYAMDADKAVPVLTDLCQKGYLRACSLLGFSYFTGRYGVLRDKELGISFYKTCAAKEKNFFCANELGRIYYKNGDNANAFETYKVSALAGNPEAEYWLGRLYLEGKGTPANSEKAIKWMRRAAHAKKSPDKKAQCALVQMSYFGIGMARSIKDTKYWLKMCDSPLVNALMSFYGHGVPKDRAKAKQILQSAGLNETLRDWADLTGAGHPTVGKKNVRDQNIPENCAKQELLFGTGRKTPKISTYAVKIFDPDYFRTFDVRDGFSDQSAGFDQTFEACGILFYTTPENKRLFNKSLRKKAIIKINRYTNACLGPETVGVCDLNLPWRESDGNGDEQ